MITVSKASIHSLISGAEVVFTVNSGVGLEALVHGRPVVASGLCDYAYAADCVRTITELEAAVASVEPDSMKGLEFLYYYTHAHAFGLSETRRLEDRIDAWLDHPVKFDPVVEGANVGPRAKPQAGILATAEAP
jgi:Capsule polysaccharide biosynthesis protein